MYVLTYNLKGLVVDNHNGNAIQRAPYDTHVAFHHLKYLSIIYSSCRVLMDSLAGIMVKTMVNHSVEVILT